MAVRTTNMAVPTPKIGRDPDTPITSTAQERMERKASEQEHMLCPAPESTWNSISRGDAETRGTRSAVAPDACCPVVQGKHRHSEPPADANATAALIMDRVADDLVLLAADGGKTMRLVAASKLVFSPVFNRRVGVLPAMHS